MAYRQMTTRRRQNVQRASYVYGNVVRQPAYEPERRAQRTQKEKDKQTGKEKPQTGSANEQRICCIHGGCSNRHAACMYQVC